MDSVHPTATWGPAAPGAGNLGQQGRPALGASRLEEETDIDKKSVNNQ